MFIAATGDVFLRYNLKGFYFKEKGFVGTGRYVYLCVSVWIYCAGWLFYFAFFLPLKDVILEENRMTVLALVDFFLFREVQQKMLKLCLPCVFSLFISV